MMDRRQLQDMHRMRLTEPGKKEGLDWTLYDFQNYAAAGQLNLAFFTTPLGGTKTLADTNLKTAGMLGQNEKFILGEVEFIFLPGSNAVSWVSQPIVKTGVALAAPNYANDMQAFAQGGYFQLKMNEKPYIQAAPLGRIPSSVGLYAETSAAVVNNNAATINEITADYARVIGRPFRVNPPIPIEGATPFSVEMNWPALVPMPSGFVGRIGVLMHGTMFRD